MSEGIEDINIQLIEFGGENGVQALVKLDKTYRITISNEEIQNSMKDIVPSLTQEEMDELDTMPVVEDKSSPEQDNVLEEKSSPEKDGIIEEDTEVYEQPTADDNIVKELNSRLEELHNNFQQESQTQLGGQSLEQVSIAVALALLNNELENKVKKSVTFAEEDNLEQINEFKEPDNQTILSNILEKGKNIVSSIQSIEDVKTEEIEKHLEDIKNEIKDKDFPKTQKSIEDVKESIDIINMKNDMSNV
jgi:hypothetical protein